MRIMEINQNDPDITGVVGTNSFQFKEDTTAGEITMLIHTEEYLRLDNSGFYVKGVKVDDPEEVYKGFAEWLKQARTIQENDGK